MRKRFVQHPVTLELVPFESYVSPRENASALVMPDIAPYKSMQTGEMIMGRRQHREHIRRHNLIEIGNEIKAHMAPQKQEPDKTLRPALIEAWKRHQG